MTKRELEEALKGGEVSGQQRQGGELLEQKEKETGGKTEEEEVEKVEEQQFVGDGGAGLLSGPVKRGSLQRWEKSREVASRQEPFTCDFSYALCTSDCVHTHCMAQDESRLKRVSVRVPFHPHVIHDVMCLSVRWSFLVFLSLLFLSVLYLFSSTLHLFSARHTIFNVDTAEG